MSSKHWSGKGTDTRSITFGVAISVSLGLSWPALASESFRCGNHLVEAGMSLDKVREYCGDPTEESGDRWIYDRGPNELVMVLHIEPNNTVGNIETRPRS